MQLFEMQGLLAGKCLPGDMKVNESLAEYLLRKLEDRNELERQLSAKTISEQNIINAFGIKGEGAHGKLVIEYVHGLVAENEDLKSTITEINNELYGQGFKVLGWHLNGDTEPLDNWFTDNGWGIPEAPLTDAFTSMQKTVVSLPDMEDAFGRKYTAEEIDEKWRVAVRKAGADFDKAATESVNLRAGVES